MNCQFYINREFTEYQDKSKYLGKLYAKGVITCTEWLQKELELRKEVIERMGKMILDELEGVRVDIG